MVTVEPPELDRTADCVWLLPTWTPAKPRAAGVASSAPGAAILGLRVAPVPLRGTVVLVAYAPLCFPERKCGEFVEVTRERLPLTPPLDTGANRTLTITLCPAATVNDRQERFTASPLCAVQTLHGGYGSLRPPCHRTRGSLGAKVIESCSI